MLIAGIVGSLVLLCFIVAIPWAIAEQINKRYAPRANGRPTLLGAFISGALMGVFAGFFPACIAYAATHRGWIAGLALAVCALAGGCLWCRFERRALGRQRPAPKPYFRKLDQMPARISEPPAI